MIKKIKCEKCYGKGYKILGVLKTCVDCSECDGAGFHELRYSKSKKKWVRV